ncbi:coiled-coil domain-containing protein 86 [Anabrus simplex]|uniref:coiled-coil domain-containing protein 86 n=1 Tax=Anabrus simplex TaxID=316456 RepID=UPI0034DD35D0
MKIGKSTASVEKRISVPSGKTDASDASEDEDKLNIPKGRPKSGRIWKSQKSRASSLIKSRGIRLSYKQKQVLKQQLKLAKELSRVRKEERERLREEQRQRRRENLKRQEENRRKSEIVQVITNTTKIKRMKKNTLRKIEKRDTTKMIQK